MSEGKRLYLTLDERLYEKIRVAAEAKGKTPTSLVVSNLEDLYMRDEAVDYDELLDRLLKEANEYAVNEPFLLADLPSFGELIISTAQKAHISPSPVRARIGKNFNIAVRSGNAGNVFRATRADGNYATRPDEFLNKAGVAMYIHRPERKDEEENE